MSMASFIYDPPIKGEPLMQNVKIGYRFATEHPHREGYRWLKIKRFGRTKRVRRTKIVMRPYIILNDRFMLNLHKAKEHNVI